MKIVFVVNKPSWAVGTLARLFALEASSGWRIEVVSVLEMYEQPGRFARRLADADIVHWMLHKTFHDAKEHSKSGVHIVSVQHIEGDSEENSGYLARASAIVGSSRRCCDEIRHLVPSGMPVKCVYYSVADTFFAAGARRLRVRLRRRTSDPLRVGFFSSAEYETNRKGIDLLPGLAVELRNAGVDWELLVTGVGWQRILSQPLFRSLPVRHVIAPSYFDMPALYAQLDAYLCLSRLEGGPMPVYEAIANGIPVISTEVGSMPELLGETDKLYYRIDQEDPSAAARALCEIRVQPGNVQAMCVRAHEVILKSVSTRHYHKCLAAVYAELLDIGEPSGQPRSPRAKRRQQKRWRAWDRTYWAKEMWAQREKRSLALAFTCQAFFMDPFCEGIWRVLLRRLGFRQGC